MEMSKLSKLGVTASRLGFGTMRFPETEPGKIDRKKSIKMIDAAYKAGVNYFDTAYLYHGGDSEIFLGEVLPKYPRESYYLADKMPAVILKNEADTDRIFDEQLSRCKTDYFDFYLMHSLNREIWDNARKYNAMEKMQKRRDAGQIKHFGFSYHGEFTDFVEILDAYDWDFVQLQINYIDWVKLDAKKYYDELVKRGIPCIIMEPVRGGFLANLPQEVLDIIGAKDNSTSAELAFRWLVGLENTPIILSGMSTLEQVQDNIRIFSDIKPLSNQEQELLAKARDKIFTIQTVPCTGCSYCMDCPSGVEIPKTMHIYNDFKLFGNTYVFLDESGKLGEHFAGGCTSCGVCKPLCPQKIDIPHWLGLIEEERKNTRL